MKELKRNFLSNLVPFNFLSTNLINCLRHVCILVVWAWVCFKNHFEEKKIVSSHYSQKISSQKKHIFMKERYGIIAIVVREATPREYAPLRLIIEKMCLFRSIKIISLALSNSLRSNVAALCQNKSDVIERKGFIFATFMSCVSHAYS